MRLHNMRWLEKYRKTFEMGFQTALEYRVNFAISLISAAYPIFIQSFLWTAIYLNATGSVVYGFTYRQIIAYTFLAGLISRIVYTGFEYEIMDDVKNGRYSKFLVQPVGYFPYRLASFFGNKLPGLAMILAILAVMGTSPLANPAKHEAPPNAAARDRKRRRVWRGIDWFLSASPVTGLPCRPP